MIQHIFDAVGEESNSMVPVAAVQVFYPIKEVLAHEKTSIQNNSLYYTIFKLLCLKNEVQAALVIRRGHVLGKSR
jgi:hypothetical protein